MGCHSTKIDPIAVRSLCPAGLGKEEPSNTKDLSASPLSFEEVCPQNLVARNMVFDSPFNLSQQGDEPLRALYENSKVKYLMVQTHLQSSNLLLSQASDRQAQEDVYNCNDSLRMTRSKLSVKPSQLHELRQHLGSWRQVLPTIRDGPRPCRVAIESVRNISTTSGPSQFFAPVEFSMDISKRVAYNPQQVEEIVENHSKRFFSSRMIQKSSDLSLDTSNRKQWQYQNRLNQSKTCSKFKSAVEVAAEPASTWRCVRTSRSSRPLTSKLDMCKQTKEISKEKLAKTRYEIARRPKPSKTSNEGVSSTKPIRNKAFKVSQGSLQDGPSLFQRSNSTRVNQKCYQRAHTSDQRLLQQEEVLPVLLVTRDENSHRIMRSIIVAKLLARKTTPGNVRSGEAVREVTKDPTQSFDLGGSSSRNRLDIMLQSRRQRVASKREIKQINVLKGKSSPFNITIKARETQLMNPTPHSQIIDKKLLMKNLLHSD